MANWTQTAHVEFASEAAALAYQAACDAAWGYPAGGTLHAGRVTAHPAGGRWAHPTRQALGEKLGPERPALAPGPAPAEAMRLDVGAPLGLDALADAPGDVAEPLTGLGSDWFPAPPAGA